MNRELLEQAFDALVENTVDVEGYCTYCGKTPCKPTCAVGSAIDALRTELEKPELAPVAWRLAHRFYSSQRDAEYALKNECVFLGTSYVPEPLYAKEKENV